MASDRALASLLEKLPDDQAQTLSLLLEAKQTQIENKDRLIESYESTIEILKADRQAHTKLELLLEKGRPGFKGSVSRAQKWERWEQNGSITSTQEPQTFDVELTVEEDRALTILANTPYENENTSCEPICQILAPLITSRLTYHTLLDTHKTATLGPYKPDLSLVLKADRAIPAYLTSFIEIKSTALGNIATPENLGKVLDYLLKMRYFQPERQMFFGLMTNLHQNVILVLDFPSTRPEGRLQRMDIVSISSALKCFVQFARNQDFQPSPPNFPKSLGFPAQILGWQANTIVGEFHLRGSAKNIPIAVKVSRPGYEDTIRNETKLLELIKKAPHQSLPILEEVYTNFPAFAISPVGKPFEYQPFQDTVGRLKGYLRSIVDAIAWCHKLEVIHRDVRPSNIIINHSGLEPTAILIDFNCGTTKKIDRYEGGYICTPYALLSEMRSTGRKLGDLIYEPKGSHDFEALVLLLAQIIQPASFRDFLSYQVEDPESPQFKLLINFWINLKDSSIWSEAITFATNSDADGLKHFIDQLFVAFR